MGTRALPLPRRVPRKPEGHTLFDAVETDIAPGGGPWAVNDCPTQVDVDHAVYDARESAIRRRLNMLD
ncbi:hypothetical protein ACIPSE_40865 [Streptomyces sp. NPDC090106]|uniref:hypothetical protein n=1 Tax=Streptomyces sp. NPDC090106 TaxID=3365946 RepID=UPI0038188285